MDRGATVVGTVRMARMRPQYTEAGEGAAEVVQVEARGEREGKKGGGVQKNIVLAWPPPFFTIAPFNPKTASQSDLQIFRSPTSQHKISRNSST